MRLSNLLHVIIFASWITFSLFTVVIETNWLRYTPSLVGTIVLIVIFIGSILSIVGLILCVKTNCVRGPALLYPAITVCTLIVLGFNMQGYGRLLPHFYFDHIVSSHEHEVMAWGKTYTYKLELVNPFSEQHIERLSVKTDNSIKVISIPLFDGKIHSYLRPSNKIRWIHLIPSEQENLFILKVSKYLRPIEISVSLSGEGAADKIERQ